MSRGGKRDGAGRPKGASAKPWSEALTIASTETTNEGKARLRALAEKTWQMALAGDMQAIKEIGDRLDGKAAQSMDVTHGPSDVFMQMLEAISNGRMADSLAEKPGQSAPVRH